MDGPDQRREPAADANDDDVGARVRATLAYARMSAADAVKVLNISKRTLDRVYHNKRDLKIPEAKRLADKAGVPLWFLLEGWNGAPTAPRITPEEAARQLGPQLLAAAQELRKAEAQERQDEAERDRLRTSLGGST